MPYQRVRPGLSHPSIATLTPLAGGAVGVGAGAALLLPICAALLIVLPSLFTAGPSNAAQYLCQDHNSVLYRAQTWEKGSVKQALLRLATVVIGL